MAKEYWVAGFSSIKYCIEELKLHMHKVFGIEGMGVKEKKETYVDIWYISNQIDCHDSRIDNLEWDLTKLMGIVDIIKD